MDGLFGSSATSGCSNGQVVAARTRSMNVVQRRATTCWSRISKPSRKRSISCSGLWPSKEPRATKGTAALKALRVACPEPLKILFRLLRTPSRGPDVTSPPSSATRARELSTLSDPSSAAARIFMRLVSQTYRGVAVARRRCSGEHYRAAIFPRQVGASGLQSSAVPSCGADLFDGRHIPPPRALPQSRPPTNTQAIITLNTCITRPMGRAKVTSRYSRCCFLRHLQGYRRNILRPRHP